MPPPGHVNLCQKFDGELQNPSSAQEWNKDVQKYLLYEPNRIQLCKLQTWRMGNRNEGPSGSRLAYEHFLHFRALVEPHNARDFVLLDHVNERFIERAKAALAPNVWSDFDNFLTLASTDPDVDVDGLGSFSSAKIAQNQVLLDALRAAESRHVKASLVSESRNEREDDEARPWRTPFKKTWLSRLTRNTPFEFLEPDSETPAADEAIVNHAIIEYLTALTRPKLEIRDPANRASKIMAARWTIQRNRFHLAERIREADNDQKRILDEYSQIFSNRFESIAQASGRKQKWVRLLETQTDGHLYHTKFDEPLAIIEAKRRARGQRKAPIEWQEAAEIMAMIHQRVRQEREERKREDGEAPQRRGLLKSPGGKNRCLLIAQDRDEVFLVVGEWDKYYEYYAVEDKLPTMKEAKPLRQGQGQGQSQGQSRSRDQQSTIFLGGGPASLPPQTPERRRPHSRSPERGLSATKVTPSPRNLRERILPFGRKKEKASAPDPGPAAGGPRPKPKPRLPIPDPRAQRSTSGPQSDSDRSALGVESDPGTWDGAAAAAPPGFDDQRGFLMLRVYGPFATTTNSKFAMDRTKREDQPLYKLSLNLLALCMHLAMEPAYEAGGLRDSRSGSSASVAAPREQRRDLELRIATKPLDKGKGKATMPGGTN